VTPGWWKGGGACACTLRTAAAGEAPRFAGSYLEPRRTHQRHETHREQVEQRPQVSRRHQLLRHPLPLHGRHVGQQLSNLLQPPHLRRRQLHGPLHAALCAVGVVAVHRLHSRLELVHHPPPHACRCRWWEGVQEHEVSVIAAACPQSDSGHMPFLRNAICCCCCCCSVPVLLPLNHHHRSTHLAGRPHFVAVLYVACVVVVYTCIAAHGGEGAANIAGVFKCNTKNTGACARPVCSAAQRRTRSRGSRLPPES